MAVTPGFFTYFYEWKNKNLIKSVEINSSKVTILKKRYNTEGEEVEPETIVWYFDEVNNYDLQVSGEKTKIANFRTEYNFPE